MSETVKTLIYVGVAVVCGIGAWLLANPTPAAPPFFDDQGQEFFPDFEDPTSASALEVIEFDEETATARPFKVEVKDGLWSIPSHHDYPADGKDRLAKTAAGVIELRKDQVISDSPEMHAELGLVDPLDSSRTELTGWGKRVTLKNATGNVLADLIVGKPVEGREGMRYVRVPGKNRAYAVEMDVDLSTRFADWIETDLLKLSSFEIEKVELDNYSVDERSGTIIEGDLVRLTKDDKSKWSLADPPEDRELDTSKVSTLTSAIDQLSIVGVRPKPPGLTGDLTQSENQNISTPMMLSLQNKGYFFTRDGKLVSNEGELRAWTKDGVRYTLRFGEVLYGSGEDVTAGSAEEDEAPAEGEEGEEGEAEEAPAGKENRYLFISADFDPSFFDAPQPPEGLDMEFFAKWKKEQEGEEAGEGEEEEAEEELSEEEQAERDRQESLAVQYQSSLEEHELKLEEGKEKAQELSERFAPWYYVISGDSFDKLHLEREDLLKAPPEEEVPAGDLPVEPAEGEGPPDDGTPEKTEGQQPVDDGQPAQEQKPEGQQTQDDGQPAEGGEAKPSGEGTPPADGGEAEPTGGEEAPPAEQPKGEGGNGDGSSSGEGKPKGDGGDGDAQPEPDGDSSPSSGKPKEDGSSG